MNRCAAIVLCCCYVVVLSFAVVARGANGLTHHDRSVIRFFQHHPRLAATPAGGKALATVLPRVVRALTSAEASTTLRSTNDWTTAVAVVQRVYPGSESWLLSCSSSEGGHGTWVPNTRGSGAGGWMQYMEGTFWGDYHSAVADLHQRGYRVPAATASWYSPLGQAIAAGWAYFHDRPAGKWTGGGC